MRLESAQSLKQELLTGLVDPFTAAAAPTGGARRAGRAGAAGSREAIALGRGSEIAVGAQALDRVPEVQRSVALGIARSGRQYRLAVRVQRQALMGSPIVEHIVSQARGEADVRLIGRIAKRPTKGSRGGRDRGSGKRAARASDRAGHDGGSKRTAAAARLADPWYRGSVQPLLIGASIGHVDITAGTIGAFVERAGRLFVLSNNHVLANEDAAQRGDTVLQPGVTDGGRDPRDRVATVSHWVRLRRRGANVVDAALADIDEDVEHDPGLLRGLVGGADQRLAGLGPDFLDEGEVVHKVGRTTGATEGRVTAFDLDNLVISYDLGNLRFDNQVEIEGAGNRAFSDGGDSGSLIVDADMRAVALLFAGGDTGGSNGLGLTYANPIGRVLKDLRADLRF